jgi:hypothetical protein
VADVPGLPKNDWILIANWIRGEKERRELAPKRRELKSIWAEIDRQVAMIPRAKEILSGQKADWIPNTELPLQFNTLEVNCADARRLKFPRGTEWYSCSSDMSEEYLAKWTERRSRIPLFGSLLDAPKMDQETANTLPKVVLDHFHRLYDFRSMIDLFDVESIKYGTGILRVKEVEMHKFFNDYRGTQRQTMKGPAVVPCSIKNVFLDDTPMAVMHEGITMSPGHIRCTFKHYKDVQNAIATGGSERGWRKEVIRRLEPEKGKDANREHIELIEFEGDLVVPRTSSNNPIFLPGVIVTVAAGRNATEVVRYQEQGYPFPSYIVGTYMRDCLDSPYGTSPLIKGQPIAEAATDCANRLLTAAALAAQPPGWYDANDPRLTGSGGPRIFPGSLSATDSPDAIEFMEAPDVAKLLQVYLAFLKQYEDLTAVNDPRRGGPIKSHTTATAADLEQTRGLSRTDDFVQGQEQGPITSLLYREYEIAKRCMSKPVPIQVDAGGIEGWVRVAAADLPDDVAFRVHGSAGVLDERTQFENFMQGTNASLQLIGMAAQMGIQVPVDFNALVLETYKRAGINNAGTFIGANSSSPGVTAAPPVPPAGEAVPGNDLTDVATLGLG